MESQEIDLPKISTISNLSVIYQFNAGGQGQVYLCSHQKDLYAVKIPLRSKNFNLERFLKENIFIKNLQHPNIIKLISFQNDIQIVCQNKSKIRCPMTVLEFAEQGDLFDYSLKRAYPQEVCRTIFGQLIDAMTYLHYEKKVMHLDIKTQNILITKDFHFKITDFGHAKTYQQIQHLNYKFSYGTDWWVPPEYGKFQEFSGQKVDVFNCGLILCKLLTSTYPIRKTPCIRNDQLYCLLKKHKYQSFWHYFKKRIPHINFSKQAERLLQCLLEPDPKKRYTFQRIKQDQWYRDTIPASQQKVVQQFLKQKNILLNDPNMKTSRQKLEQIKALYQNLNMQKQPEEENQNSNIRGQKIKALCKFYKYLKQQKHSFEKVPCRNKFKIPYCKYKPQFIVVYLKRQLQNLLDEGTVLFNDFFSMYNPIEHRLQVIDIVEGVIKVTCINQCSGQKLDIGQNEQQNVSISCQYQKQINEIQIQIFGQIVKNGQTFGVDWDLSDLNKNDCWSRQTICELKRIIRMLKVDVKQEQSEQNEQKSLKRQRAE